MERLSPRQCVSEHTPLHRVLLLPHVQLLCRVHHFAPGFKELERCAPRGYSIGIHRVGAARSVTETVCRRISVGGRGCPPPGMAVRMPLRSAYPHHCMQIRGGPASASRVSSHRTVSPRRVRSDGAGIPPRRST